MGIHIDQRLKQQLIFLIMLLMLFSLFTSRALLSISLIAFLLLTCVHKNLIQQLAAFIRNPFLVGISLLFFLPFTSWFWSEDKQLWLRFARIKLPLLLLPVSFAGNWQLNSKQWRWIAYSFILLVFGGCCWSLWKYYQNTSLIHAEYLKAKIFDTPLDNDHVRYSLVVCIAFICCLVLFRQTVLKNVKLALIVYMAFFTVYLHVLSARTGLISFYIFILLSVFYFIFSVKKKVLTLVLIAVLIIMPLLAWFLFPTFQNRVRYNVYDLTNVFQNRYVAGSNDGNRILSLRAGWEVLNQHPLGTGTDVINDTYQWYDLHAPHLKGNERLFPSSEVLMYAGFAGWIGLILFLVVMSLPFFEKLKNNCFFWLALNSIMAFSFLFDIGLEAQFGVFIYGFVVLWWWKWFRALS